MAPVCWVDQVIFNAIMDGRGVQPLVEGVFGPGRHVIHRATRCVMHWGHLRSVPDFTRPVLRVLARPRIHRASCWLVSERHPGDIAGVVLTTHVTRTVPGFVQAPRLSRVRRVTS